MDEPHTTPAEDPRLAGILDQTTRSYRESLGTAPRTVTEMASVTFREQIARPAFGIARVVLVLTALAGFAFDLPVLLGGAQHTSQDVAVLHTAIGMGFLLAAWRPTRYARGLAPVALAAAVLLALPLSAGTDVIVSGHVEELSHLPLLVGAATLTFGGWLSGPRGQVAA